MIKKLISPTDLNSFSVCNFGVKRQKVIPIFFKQISRTVCQTKVSSQMDSLNIIREDDFHGYSDLCLTLIDMCHPAETPVWESIITSIKNFPKPLQKRLFERIFEKLGKFSEGKDLDSIGFITELIYLERREFLERDLLQLVSDCSQMVLPSSFKHKIRNVPLIKICARNISVAYVVMEILNCLIFRAYESDTIRKFVNIFCICSQSNCVSEEIWKRSRSYELYDECVHALVKKLEEFSGELDDKRKGACVKAIALECQKLVKRGTTHQKQRMLLALIHHLDVYYKVIEFSFMCDKTIVLDCLDVLTIYKVQNLEDAKRLKEAVLPVITCLRALLQKISLGIRDIKCAVMDVSDISTKTLLGQFLITFMLKSEGGLKLAPEILQMATGSELPLHYLEATLEAHDNLNIRLNQWPVFKQNQYKALIRGLVDGCTATEEPKHSELLSAAAYIVQKS
ncbi:uncharacterized protein LOC134255195 [Saccostrea cucullata]|uniref:uncharacterized protein LOC134255195 n=1 Tax=Saccostrea cuccullata TaxID=36930 RepID=UPI002ED467CC